MTTVKEQWDAIGTLQDQAEVDREARVALRSRTVDGLEAEIVALDHEMWAILSKLTGTSYGNVWDQYKELDKAQEISQRARKLRQARDIVQRRAMTEDKP